MGGGMEKGKERRRAKEEKGGQERGRDLLDQCQTAWYGAPVYR